MQSNYQPNQKDSVLGGHNEQMYQLQVQKLQEQVEELKKKNEFLLKDNVKKLETVTNTDEKLRVSVMENTKKEKQIQNLKQKSKSHCSCQ